MDYIFSAFEIEILTSADLARTLEDKVMARAARDWSKGDLGLKDLICLAERRGHNPRPEFC